MSAQQVAPTRMALQTYKGKLVGAKKGYELLKKKSDALKVTDAIDDFFLARLSTTVGEMPWTT